jgi:transposase
VNRHALTDEQWAAISPRLPQQRGPKSECANRNFIDAVIWLATTGAAWRDLDASFGPWKTIYNRFRNWALRGWWNELFRGIPIEEKVGSILDATIVRAHQDSAGGRGGPVANALGRSRGGFSTKLHAVVSLQGQPIELRLTPGQQHEATIAEELLDFVHGDHCLADGGYDADRILDALHERELKAVIPPSKVRKHKRRIERDLYRLRYKIEVFFHHLKRYRRIATRYDKTAPCYMGFVYVICALRTLA